MKKRREGLTYSHQVGCAVCCTSAGIISPAALFPATLCIIGPAVLLCAVVLLSLSLFFMYFHLLDLCEKQKFVIQIAFYILCRTCILTQNIGFSPFFRPLRTFPGITPGNFDTYSLVCPSVADFSALIRASRLRIISRSFSVMTDAVTSDLSVGLSPAESLTSWKQ